MTIDEQTRGFASDNYAGAHPEVLAAIAAANDADAMAIAGPAMQDFKRLQDEQGVRAAVEDRDAPFSSHRTYWEAYQASKRGS